jgi:hypothetical protein
MQQENPHPVAATAGQDHGDTPIPMHFEPACLLANRLGYTPFCAGRGHIARRYEFELDARLTTQALARLQIEPARFAAARVLEV